MSAQDSTGITVTRSGFRKAPIAVKELAEAYVADHVACEWGPGHVVRAELRRAVYCGPGSAGDRGDWTLAISGQQFSLHSIPSA